MHFFCDPVFAQVTKRQKTCLYLSPRCQRISEGITWYSGGGGGEGGGGGWGGGGGGGGGIRGSVVTSRVEVEAGNSHLTANEGVS